MTTPPRYGLVQCMDINAMVGKGLAASKDAVQAAQRVELPDEPKWADEMDGWIEGLEYDEPELHEALMLLGEAIETEDLDIITEAWGAVDAAMAASNPEYPALSDDERAQASERIRHHHHHLDQHTGGRLQAIAIGLREAAPQKYAAFEKARES